MSRPRVNDGIRIGALGTGGFGLFALEQFAAVPGVSISAVADIDPEAANAASNRFGAPVADVVDLTERDDVDLVYISTPPYLHHPQSVAALTAGKHVLCEKPLAVTLAQADEMIGLAHERGLLLVADLMQRYNPLYAAIQGLVSTRLIGDPLHGYFENYASDEQLMPGHWFWDRSKSGGIFIEHGVHFFDMFDGWLGPGAVLAAQRVMRPGGIEEQVGCTVQHPGGVLVNHYHGFTQPSVMDRQELRIVFELGDVTLDGWIPLSARIRALVGSEQAARLLELFPGGELDVAETYAVGGPQVTRRHESHNVSEMVELRWEAGVAKHRRYGELVAALLVDQARWIEDRSHSRVITALNGRASLALAVQATALADRQGREPPRRSRS